MMPMKEIPACSFPGVSCILSSKPGMCYTCLWVYMCGMHENRDQLAELIRELVRVREGRALPTSASEQELIDQLSEATFAKYYDAQDRHVHCGGEL